MRYEDTHYIEHSPRDINNTYTGIIGVIRKEFKIMNDFNHPDIVVSSIFPRRDHMDRVNSLNKALLLLGQEVTGVRYLNNSNLDMSMLKPNDRKHLDFNGFRTLLANIRYVLFGKLPKARVSRFRHT